MEGGGPWFHENDPVVKIPTIKTVRDSFMVTGSASERTIVGWQSRKVMVRVQARCGGVRKSFIYTGTVYKSIDRGDFLLSALTCT